MVAMWRIAEPADDDRMVELCRGLYDEDPGPLPVPPANMRATLEELRYNPHRGRAVVLEIQNRLAGYALLIPFWSNELGGNVCEVDELFIIPERRNQGHGTALFKAIANGVLWPSAVVGIALGVTPDNSRARRLYERLGFAAVGVSMVYRIT